MDLVNTEKCGTVGSVKMIKRLLLSENFSCFGCRDLSDVAQEVKDAIASYRIFSHQQNWPKRDRVIKKMDVVTSIAMFYDPRIL